MACNKSNLLLTKTLPSLEAKREEEGILKGGGGKSEGLQASPTATRYDVVGNNHWARQS